MQIIVLGMHRSGTSLVTRMVNMLGAYAGDADSMLGFKPENPKGYWERKDLIEYNIGLLKLHNVDWRGYNVAHWPVPLRPENIPPPVHQAMQTLIMTLNDHSPWVIKDPRLCLTLPYWRPLLQAPVCVIVYRDPLEISESLHHRQDMPLSIERGIALWELYAVSLLNASADLPRVFVSHSDFLYDPISTTTQLYHGLINQGVKELHLPATRDITGFIDTKLHRSKPGTHLLTDYQQRLAGFMRGDYPPSGALSVSAESRKLLEQH